MIEQLLVKVLPAELFDLGRVHFALIGCNLAVSFATNLQKYLFRRRCKQRGLQFLFEDRELALEILEP